MKEKYKWRKSTTEILLGRLVKMRILKKKRIGFQLNYEVLVTKKEYLDVIKEEKDVSKYDNFLHKYLQLYIKRRKDRGTNKSIYRKYAETRKKIILYFYMLIERRGYYAK
ncbi:BlaI/MecI/CopY family transcriptional regulator [Clostridioides difficile]|uniref:BlaI/MecI/CopY family transcriptional regulator n=1 Tax=Clostridioides difficile TaxID=1496 RepID=UPI001EEE6F20|nr:BlaI/MecI/CopY family transcriptional regulator [Clostridioides difficile]